VRADKFTDVSEDCAVLVFGVKQSRNVLRNAKPDLVPCCRSAVAFGL
jgi:hypothetical protein